MRSLRVIALLLILTAGLSARAQLYRNNFDNGYTWYPPWENLVIGSDSTLAEGDLVCVCDTTKEFGLGFDYKVPDTLRERNLHLRFEADYRFPDTTGSSEIAISIDKASKNLYWTSYPLTPFGNDSAQWFHVAIETNIPNDYLEGARLRLFLWNRSHSRIHADNAEVEMTMWSMPSFLPEIQHDSITEDRFVLRQDDSLQTPLTFPIGMLTEYVLQNDTISEFHLFSRNANSYLSASNVDTTNIVIFKRNGKSVLFLTTTFFESCHLLRQALVVPFIDSTATVFRRNMSIDSTMWQSEYYLDREGFKIGEGDRTVISYHQTGISSTQFDAIHRIAYFNLDYWRDHPMIHYPLSDTLTDYFEDISSRPIYKGMQWDHFFPLHIGNDIPNLPRIMPIPYGYESGIIFTEHADWTDIRTHRAILFGSENITMAKDATGGFVYYGIPVTKSVFYNNPDQVTNDAISHGTFKGLHCTIKTDREFEKLLKQLHKLGFDICLHTPEQHTTFSGNLKKALDYMQRNFKSTTWIDHGYNNGWKNNREDLVCDGLYRQSLFYAGSQWQSHGIKYLWNAYYEENPMEQWHFDNNLMQPYPGFGDALPNRQITTIVGHDFFQGSLTGSHRLPEPDFLSWCTPSTLEAVTNEDWDFYYSNERLQRLVDNHDVHITHVYPAWVRPGRTFWTYDADSTIIALPGMNRALERIAALRDKHKMLPMTVRTYLDYYSELLHVNYEIIDAEHIRLYNSGTEDIKGFTLLCPSPIRFEDNRFYEFRKSGDQYYVWFDLKAHETVTLKLLTPNS